MIEKSKAALARRRAGGARLKLGALREAHPHHEADRRGRPERLDARRGKDRRRCRDGRLPLHHHIRVRLVGTRGDRCLPGPFLHRGVLQGLEVDHGYAPCLRLDGGAHTCPFPRLLRGAHDHAPYAEERGGCLRHEAVGRCHIRRAFQHGRPQAREERLVLRLQDGPYRKAV